MGFAKMMRIKSFVFYFGKYLIYFRIGNAYLEFHIEVKKAEGTNFAKADESRLVNDAFAFVFQDGRISTSSGK